MKYKNLFDRTISENLKQYTVIPAYTVEARKHGILKFLFRKVLL